MTFDLNKDVEKTKFILQKRNLPAITAEVVLDLDISGSTKSLYERGVMQEAVQRVLPIAINFDDNGEVPVYTFSDGSCHDQVETMLTAANYTDYVLRQILRNSDVRKWGGTDYVGVLTANLTDLGFLRKKADRPVVEKKGLLARIFGKEDPEENFHGPQLHADSNTRLPALIYFVTDGVNTDMKETEQLLNDCATNNVQAYFNFIGVGDTHFPFLEKIADQFPNVGFAKITDLASAAQSDAIYEYLLPTELTDWLKPFIKAAGA